MPRLAISVCGSPEYDIERSSYAVLMIRFHSDVAYAKSRYILSQRARKEKVCVVECLASAADQTDDVRNPLLLTSVCQRGCQNHVVFWSAAVLKLAHVAKEKEESRV